MILFNNYIEVWPLKDSKSESSSIECKMRLMKIWSSEESKNEKEFDMSISKHSNSTEEMTFDIEEIQLAFLCMTKYLNENFEDWLQLKNKFL